MVTVLPPIPNNILPPLITTFPFWLWVVPGMTTFEEIVTVLPLPINTALFTVTLEVKVSTWPIVFNRLIAGVDPPLEDKGEVPVTLVTVPLPHPDVVRLELPSVQTLALVPRFLTVALPRLAP